MTITFTLGRLVKTGNLVILSAEKIGIKKSKINIIIFINSFVLFQKFYHLHNL